MIALWSMGTVHGLMVAGPALEPNLARSWARETDDPRLCSVGVNSSFRVDAGARLWLSPLFVLFDKVVLHALALSLRTLNGPEESDVARTPSRRRRGGDKYKNNTN